MVSSIRYEGQAIGARAPYNAHEVSTLVALVGVGIKERCKMYRILVPTPRGHPINPNPQLRISKRGIAFLNGMAVRTWFAQTNHVELFYDTTSRPQRIGLQPSVRQTADTLRLNVVNSRFKTPHPQKQFSALALITTLQRPDIRGQTFSLQWNARKRVVECCLPHHVYGVSK
jgi:hypothetical protein